MEPTSILSAQTSTTRPEIYKNGLDETTIALLEFPGGVAADIKTSFGDYMNFITINCDQGDIKMQPYSEYNGQNGTTPLGIVHHPYEVPFQQAKQMDEDALSILEKRPILAPGEEGRRDIRVVEAIYKSASSKQPVKL